MPPHTHSRTLFERFRPGNEHVVAQPTPRQIEEATNRNSRPHSDQQPGPGPAAGLAHRQPGKPRLLDVARSDSGDVCARGNVGRVYLADYHQWWKHQGGQELRRLLMEQWDPIGVKASPEAADEYDGYRSALLLLLREGAPAQRIAEHPARIEQRRMDFKTTPEQLVPLGEQLVSWYADSLARWEASHPAR